MITYDGFFDMHRTSFDHAKRVLAQINMTDDEFVIWYKSHYPECNLRIQPGSDNGIVLIKYTDMLNLIDNIIYEIHPVTGGLA